MVRRAKILGIWISVEETEEDSYLLNFKEPLDKIKNVCEAWNDRSLTLKGKITIANSILVSTLQYPCSIVHTPLRVVKEYRKIITQFLWNGRRAKISYVSITQPVARGGLNLIDLETRIRVNYLQWIRRLTAAPQMNTSIALSHMLQTEDLSLFFRSKDPAQYKNNPINRFYSNMLALWYPLRCFEPVEEMEMRREPIWTNKLISWRIPHDKRKIWEHSGISLLNDICKEGEGRLLSHLELNEKFGLKSSFLDMLGLRLAIPLHWRQSISHNFQGEPFLVRDLHIKFGESNPLLLANLSSKCSYRELISRGPIENTAYTRWLDEDPSLKISGPEEWAEVCLSPFSSTRDT